MANRTTLVDNNTWNNSHIALVGMAMSSPEEKAYEIMRTLGVDYVLVIFGGLIGYSGDDINKFLWMVRIAEGEHPQDIKVSGRGASQRRCVCGHFGGWVWPCYCQPWNVSSKGACFCVFATVQY